MLQISRIGKLDAARSKVEADLMIENGQRQERNTGAKEGVKQRQRCSSEGIITTGKCLTEGTRGFGQRSDGFR